ncbi:MAG: endopeptidase La [Synergistaceae bacterium]|nr:endopeptidase La [Synergistaceae bacterium]
MNHNIEDLPLVTVYGVSVLPHILNPLIVTVRASVSALEYAASKGLSVFVVGEMHQADVNSQPEMDNLYSIGTICSVEMNQSIRLPDGSLRIVLMGLSRAKIESLQDVGDFKIANVTQFTQSKRTSSAEVGTLMRSVIEQCFRNDALDFKFPGKINPNIQDIKNPEELIYVALANTTLKYNVKQEILAVPTLLVQLRRLLVELLHENSLLEMQHNLEEEVKRNLDIDQKKYYLREKLKIINEELGDDISLESEANELLKKAQAVSMPNEIFVKVKKELNRLKKLQPGSPEAGVSRAYVEILCDLPWNISSTDNLNIKSAKQILNKDHWGLDEAKERILEYLVARKRAGQNIRNQILCFVGAPGVGKTSIARSIARAMGREFVQIALGGMHDEAEIRGHRRTYLGAQPGRIIYSIKQCGVNNPLILLDEIDKISSDYKGDPASALLEVLDSEQNSHFTDNFLEVSFDLSKVVFITTANNYDAIPYPLLDRMEIISLSGYVMEEKLQIAKRHLLPKIRKEHGLTEHELIIEDDLVKKIIIGYTHEAGVRQLDRVLCKIARKVAVQFEEAKNKDIDEFTLTDKYLLEFLGSPKSYDTLLPVDPNIGTGIGLAWTSTGGDVLLIQAVKMVGSGRLKLTGNLGDIFKESATNALAHIKSNAKLYGLNKLQWNKVDVHVHVPAGAVPKDGPSAGITIAVALFSALTEKEINNKFAMTGEMSLTGDVLPIGGIKEKILAARRLGINELIIPLLNKPDVADLKLWVKKGLKLHYVSRIDQVFKLVFKK